MCKSYWAASRSPGTNGWPFDVKGIVEEVQVLQNSKILLLIDTGTETTSVSGLSGGERHLTLSELETGDEVAVFNLTRSNASRSFRETQLTTIYKMLNGIRVKN